MLCIMLAYLMLFAALSNAVCLYNAYFFAIYLLIFFSFLVCLYQILFCIMHSAFNLLIFPNFMFTPFFYSDTAMCSLD